MLPLQLLLDAQRPPILLLQFLVGGARSCEPGGCAPPTHTRTPGPPHWAGPKGLRHPSSPLSPCPVLTICCPPPEGPQPPASLTKPSHEWSWSPGQRRPAPAWHSNSDDTLPAQSGGRLPARPLHASQGTEPRPLHEGPRAPAESRQDPVRGSPAGGLNPPWWLPKPIPQS